MDILHQALWSSKFGFTIAGNAWQILWQNSWLGPWMTDVQWKQNHLNRMWHVRSYINSKIVNVIVILNKHSITLRGTHQYFKHTTWRNRQTDRNRQTNKQTDRDRQTETDRQRSLSWSRYWNHNQYTCQTSNADAHLFWMAFDANCCHWFLNSILCCKTACERVSFTWPWSRPVICGKASILVLQGNAPTLALKGSAPILAFYGSTSRLALYRKAPACLVTIASCWGKTGELNQASGGASARFLIVCPHWRQTGVMNDVFGIASTSRLVVCSSRCKAGLMEEICGRASASLLVVCSGWGETRLMDHVRGSATYGLNRLWGRATGVLENCSSGK